MATKSAKNRSNRSGVVIDDGDASIVARLEDVIVSADPASEKMPAIENVDKQKPHVKCAKSTSNPNSSTSLNASSEAFNLHETDFNDIHARFSGLYGAIPLAQSKGHSFVMQNGPRSIYRKDNIFFAEACNTLHVFVVRMPKRDISDIWSFVKAMLQSDIDLEHVKYVLPDEYREIKSKIYSENPDEARREQDNEELETIQEFYDCGRVLQPSMAIIQNLMVIPPSRDPRTLSVHFI